jgi:hypothetical protein
MHSQEPSRGQVTAEVVPPQNTLTTLPSHTHRKRCPAEPRELKLNCQLPIAKC